MQHNFQIRENAAYTGTYSDGAAELYVDTNENTELVFVATYEGKTCKDIDFVKLDGSNNKAELAVDAKDGCATKLFIWDGVTCEPLFAETEL